MTKAEVAALRLRFSSRSTATVPKLAEQLNEAMDLLKRLGRWVPPAEILRLADSVYRKDHAETIEAIRKWEGDK